MSSLLIYASESKFSTQAWSTFSLSAHSASLTRALSYTIADMALNSPILQLQTWAIRWTNLRWWYLFVFMGRGGGKGRVRVCKVTYVDQEQRNMSSRAQVLTPSIKSQKTAARLRHQYEFPWKRERLWYLLCDWIMLWKNIRISWTTSFFQRGTCRHGKKTIAKIFFIQLKMLKLLTVVIVFW